MSGLFFRALFLCLFLSFVGQAQSVNSSNFLKQLLDLPAPAPRYVEPNTEPEKPERPSEFYADERVPPDNAPIEDLVDYWSVQSNAAGSLKYQIKPSEKTLERLLEYCEDNPEQVGQFLSLFPTKPDVAEKLKDIYDRLVQAQTESTYLRNQVRSWLKYNSKYYLDELIKEAQSLSDNEDYVSNPGKDALKALARVDWDSAKTIVERLENNANQPNSAIVAKWAIYQHAVETGDDSTAERYRTELQKIVEDKKATAGQRDLAMDSLVLNGDFPGRDEWYMSLLEDETLLAVQEEGYTGLTTLISMSPPKKWTETMIKLTKSENLAVRSAAVRNLMEVFDKERKDIVEALLPWLNNPAWAKESDDNERYDYISALADIDFPQAIPGLIRVVQNESGGKRGLAAVALAKYKDARAIPALRFALQDEKNIENRKEVINALIACGGIGDDEQMTSLEAFATLSSTPEGLERIENYENASGEEEDEDEEDDEDGKKLPPLPLNIIVGKFIAEQTEPGEGVAARAVERLKVLRKTKPLVAKVLAEIIKNWKGRVVYLETMRQIKTGEADVDMVLNLLANREDARRKIPNEIISLRATDGAARGIGACLSEDAGEFSSILNQADAETRIAMFSCARLTRAKLPVADVGALLKSENAQLALAAERYLQAEDSVQARTLVLSRHAGEAVILGARQAFVPLDVKNDYKSQALNQLFYSVADRVYVPKEVAEIKKAEENLRAEIKENAELLVVYALLPDDAAGRHVVRVYKNRIVYSFYEDTARYRERDLTPEEYERFYQFLLANNIDGLAGFQSDCDTCESSEFVMFGKGGGRRVFFDTYRMPKQMEAMKELFYSFAKGNLRLHYYLSDKLKNLEVLFADENFSALAVWKKDADLRVLVEDKAKKIEILKNLNEQEKAENLAAGDNEDAASASARYEARQARRRDAEFAHLSWRAFAAGNLGSVLPQPLEAQVLPDETQVPPIDGISKMPRSWQVRAGNFEIRDGTSPHGLYKISRGQTPVKIRDGYYSAPVVTADGKWAVVSSYEDDGWNAPNTVARINLETGKEFPVNLPPANTFVPVAYVSAQNKILLFRARGRYYRLPAGNFYVDNDSAEDPKNPSPKVPEYYLLDANTGAVELVKGDFRPLEQQTYRPLQPTSSAGEFWAAVYDEKTKTTEIGRYSQKTFTLQTVLKLPDIFLNSMQIWVDEKESKVYFVYQGHLLALPLK
jgi:HEAT repeats